MKRTILLLVTAALFAVAAIAQSTNTGGTSAPANTKPAKSGAKASTAKPGAAGKSATSTVTGCLNGPNAENAYMLTNGRYKKGLEVGMPGSDELSKHVGHKVKLTGMWAKSGEEIGENEKMEKSENAGKGVKREKGEAAEKHFKVTKIDHLADSCTMGGSGKPGATTEKNSKGAITSSNTDDKMTKKEQEKQKSASSYPK